LITRPILAIKFGNNKRSNGTVYTVQEDIERIPYPVYGTPKIDGIRCFIAEGQATSRSGKPIRNAYISDRIANLPEYCEGLDGELVTYTNGKMDAFNTVQSKVMTGVGKPDFKYLVFDHCITHAEAYNERVLRLLRLDLERNWIEKILPVSIMNVNQLEAYESDMLEQGFEGICLRKPFSTYKEGRSTWNEFYLAALTRWTRAECRIIGFEEQESNQNEAFINELGYSKRTTHQEGKVLTGTLGKFLVEDIETGEKFSVGGGQGVTAEFRQNVWDNKVFYLGKIFTYKHKSFGRKEAPRHPQFVGFRDKDDMS
jgi:DNA ligase-1